MAVSDSDFTLENNTYYSYPDYDQEDQTQLGSYDIQGIVINSVLLYIGLCTHIWMLWSLFKSRQVGSRAQCYLLALCISEMLGLIIYCSLQITLRVTKMWSAGTVGCKILMALLEFSTLGHYILVAFNVDNVITVMRGRSTMVIRVVLIVLSILCTVAIAIPQAVMSETIEYNFMRSTLRVCVMTDATLSQLNMALAVGIPTLLVILVGGPSLCLWCARKGALSQSAYKEDGSGADARNIGQDVGLVLVLDVFFILCWSPLLLFMFVADFTGYHMMFHVIGTTLATANTCFNPLVYAVFNCLNRRKNRSSPEL